MQVAGNYYPPRSSVDYAAAIQLDDLGNCELLCKGVVKQFQPIDALDISPRIGSSVRKITFPDGGLFETRSNDAIDTLLVKHDKQRFNRLTHFLESNGNAIIAVTLGTIACIGLLTLYILPIAAKKSAAALPADVVQSLGSDTFTFLDKFVLGPSELPSATQERLQEQLQLLLPYADPSMRYQLKFRKLPDNMANAFALPDGTMIISDGLVELSTDNNQLLAVLAHEMGHIERRHHIRQAIESQGLFVLMVVITGDIVSFGNLAAALPGAILKSSFSRDMETEADEYAADLLQAVNIPSHHLGDILTLIDEHVEKETGKSGKPSMLDYLSSHPNQEQRLKDLRDYVTGYGTGSE